MTREESHQKAIYFQNLFDENMVKMREHAKEMGMDLVLSIGNHVENSPMGFFDRAPSECMVNVIYS